MRLFLVVFGVLLLMGAQAQTFGGHPPGQHWQQLRNEQARVIFPRGLVSQASRIASVMEYMQQRNTRSIGEALLPIDVVLQVRTVIPNGYVGLAPYRSEFYSTPFQSFHRLGSVDWLDQLAIHEYRHVQQFSNANRGLTRLMHRLQGQLGWVVMSNLSVPDWFWEGDAVIAETALTAGGRGRMPSFSREQRALLLAGENYRYAKARNGSLRDLVPNHYPLGYTLLTFARDSFGNDLWRQVLAEGAGYRSLLYPFSQALQRHTGLSTPQLYRAAYTNLAQAQQQQLARTRLTPTRPLVRLPATTVTDYEFPYSQADGSVVALRSSYRQTERLVKVWPDGRETVIGAIGFQTEPYLFVAGEQAVWHELEQHPRWYNQSYSVLVRQDLRTGQQYRLTRRSRLFAPAIDPQGRRIVAVHVADSSLRAALHILDAQTGTLLQVLPNAIDDFQAYPRWTPDGQSVVYLARRNHELAILLQPLAGGAPRQLTDWTPSVIDHPYVLGERVYFSAAREGVDNIFSVSLAGDRLWQQHTAVPVGAYFPALTPGGDSLLLCEQTARGLSVTTLPLDTLADSPAKVVAVPVAFADEGGNILDRIPERPYQVRPYRSVLAGLQLHSWSFNGSYTTPGVELLLENMLATLQASASVLYNRNEGQLAYAAGATYAGWWPWLNASLSVRNRTTSQLVDRDSFSFVRQEYRQFNYGLQTSLPLRWRRGNFGMGVTPAIGYQRYHLSGGPTEPQQLAPNFGAWQGSLAVSALRRRARQQVQSRLGIVGSLRYQRASSGAAAQQWRALTTLYLPGLWPTHGLQIGAGWQQEDLTNAYQFPDLFPYPLGYTAPINDRISKWSVHYQLPLLYSDWGVAGITYFQRVRVAGFFEQGTFAIERNRGEPFRRTLRSVGAELYLDNVWLNVQAATLGLRASYRLTEDIFDPDRRFDFQFFVEGLLE